MESENIFSVLNNKNIRSIYCSSDDSIVDANFNKPNCTAPSSDSENEVEHFQNVAHAVVLTKTPDISRRQLRNFGKSYTSTAGKLIPARVVRPLESCRKRCADRITHKEQQFIHKKYWEQGSYNLRKAYVSGLIEIQETNTIKRIKHERNPRRRGHSYYYFLEVGGNRISVCQKCFRFTLSETEQFIKTIAKAKLEGNIISGDLRGKHSSSRKLSMIKELQILDFIKSFTSYHSRYTRRDTSKRYLPSDLSVAEIHRLYGLKYNYSVSLSKFSQLFGTLNLKFKKPKVNTCT